MLEPVDAVLRYGHKVEGGTDYSQEHCAKAKDGGTTICAPRPASVDEQTPYQKGEGEDEEKGGIEDVADRVGDVEYFLLCRESGEYETGRCDGQGAWVSVLSSEGVGKPYLTQK